MNGKTFIRALGLAQSYGHGWAGALMSEVAREDPVAGPFARAALTALNVEDMTARLAAEEEMAALAEGFDRQKELIGAVDRLRKAEGLENPGIFAGDSFYERNGELEYCHSTGSHRLEVWVYDGVVDFSISRPNVSHLLGITVSLDGSSVTAPSDSPDSAPYRPFRVYSGEPDGFLAEDHDACVRRWERHLRERHVWAAIEAVASFFGSVADRELRLEVEKAVYAQAADVFRRQEDTVEVSCWNRRTEKRNTIVLKENDAFVGLLDTDAPLSSDVRVPLFQELQRIDACAPDVPPTLIPFDYAPSSPDAPFFRECFGLPEEGVRHEDMRGMVLALGDGTLRYPGNAVDVTLLFAAGVTPDDVRRHAEKHAEMEPGKALEAGLRDAVAEREGKGAFLAERCSLFTTANYPARSLEAVEIAYGHCCPSSGLEDVPDERDEEPDRGL